MLNIKNKTTMKKTERLLQTALSLTLLMLFCACSKDDDPVPAATAAEEQFLLTGTVWESTNDYHEPIFGEDLVFENRYEFTTDSTGTIRQILKSIYGVDTAWFTLRYTFGTPGTANPLAKPGPQTAKDRSCRKQPWNTIRRSKHWSLVEQTTYLTKYAIAPTESSVPA